MRTLIASTVRQKPEILNEFLQGLDELNKPEKTDYLFVLSDMGEDERIVHRWCEERELTECITYMNSGLTYVKDDSTTHQWTKHLVAHVTEMKNFIIEYARKNKYDYLFFTDSDQVYHPDTLLHLIEQKKDIVGCISWARWNPNDPEMPNAWFQHPYEFKGKLNELREPWSIIHVAGFGGCYLLSKKAIRKGVSFTESEGYPDNWGEDRYFHINSARLGFDSYIDTWYPYFHIYRDSDVERLHEWKQNEYMFKPVELKHGTVLIAVPIGEKEVHPQLTAWITRTLMRNRNWGLDINRAHPIDNNRNIITQKFLNLPEAQKYEWLLMVDSDIVPPDGAVEKMLSHGQKIVGAVCFIMGKDGFPVPNISKDMQRGHHEATLIQVEGMGTGCMLIHREVLEKMERNHFRFQYDENGVVSKAGEDYDFCEKAVKQGYKIHADLGVQCSHYKEVDLTRLNKQLGQLLSEKHHVQRPQKRP